MITVLLSGFLLVAGLVSEIMKFPVDDLEGVITRSGIEIDRTISSDNKASLRITATGPRTVRLYEIENLDVEKARLIYKARLRTQDLKGKAYLEMWCHFPGKGEFFSRALDQPYSGTTNWSTTETAFFLRKGQNPDRVRLNVVVEGSGTVWIDDIRLLKAPLR